MNFFTSVLILLLSISQSFGQNFLFEKGQSGFHLLGNAGIYDTSPYLGVSTGYTVKGRLTLQFFGQKGFESKNRSEVNQFGVDVNYLVLKQNQRMPISLGLGAGYTRNSIQESSFTSNVYHINGGLYHKISLKKDWSVIPGLLIGYSLHYDPECVDGCNPEGINSKLMVNFRKGRFTFTPSYQLTNYQISTESGSSSITKNYRISAYELKFGMIIPN